MAIIDQSHLQGKIRDRPIGNKLKLILDRAADLAEIDVVRVTSGSQPGTHGRRTGSTRHDDGRAADLQLLKDGRVLQFTDQDCGAEIKTFITAAATDGATGIGAGVGYMGPKTLHVGFGTSPQDRSRLVWGKGGRSANAPSWLRACAEEGWRISDSSTEIGLPSAGGAGRFVVIAREGLNLRKGPGLGFGITRTIETGTEVTVVGFDGPGGEWARVDLQGDGLVDGHLFAAFLEPASPDGDSHEQAEEPGEGEV